MPSLTFDRAFLTNLLGTLTDRGRDLIRGLTQASPHRIADALQGQAFDPGQLGNGTEVEQQQAFGVLGKGLGSFLLGFFTGVLAAGQAT